MYNSGAINDSNQEEYDYWLGEIKRLPKLLKDVPDHLKDYAMCLAAIRKHGFALEHVPSHLVDAKMVIYAVKRDGMALNLVPKKFLTTPICIMACESDTRAIRFVPRHLMNEVGQYVLRLDGQTLRYVKNVVDNSLYMVAVESSPLALQHVPRQSQTYEMCMSAVQRNGEALQFVSNDLMTEELIATALKNDRFGWASQCIPKSLLPHFEGLTKPLKIY